MSKILASGNSYSGFDPHSRVNCLHPEGKKIVEARVRNLVEERGDSRITSTCHLTACHEAGHIMAHQLRGHSPLETRIWKDRELRCYSSYSLTHDTESGHVDPLTTPPGRVVTLAFEWMAGFFGEKIFGDTYDPATSPYEIEPARFILEGVSNWLHVPHRALVASVELYLSVWLLHYKDVGLRLVRALKRKRMLRSEELSRLLQDVSPKGGDVIAREIIELSLKMQTIPG